MAHGRPCTRHAVLQFLQGLDDRGERRFIESGYFSDTRSTTSQELPDTRFDMLGTNPREWR